MKYSTKHIATILQEMDTPYQDFLARALVALIVGRKAVINQISKLMPGKANPEANRQHGHSVFLLWGKIAYGHFVATRDSASGASSFVMGLLTASRRF